MLRNGNRSILNRAKVEPDLAAGEETPGSRAFEPAIERVPVARGNVDCAGMRPTYAIDEAEWLWHPDLRAEEPGFVEFSLEIDAGKEPFELEVTADQRFELSIDGELVARGPDCSDVKHWSFARYRLIVSHGPHRLRALVWWLGNEAPHARMSWRGGFALAGIGTAGNWLTTGIAPWKVRRLHSHKTVSQTDFEGRFLGGELLLDASIEEGDWTQPAIVSRSKARPTLGIFGEGWRLFPADLADQRADSFSSGRIRFAMTEPMPEDRPWPETDGNPELRAACQMLLDEQVPLVVEPGSTVALLWDFQDYICGYPEIGVNGGAGARIRWQWAESLYCSRDFKEKGNRSEVTGKFFRGFADEFRTGDGARVFHGHWWRSGRYALVTIQAGKEGLTVDSLWVRRTGYPWRISASIDAGDSEIREVAEICTNGLLNSAHETFVDCPYYEQLMYAGDSRIEALTGYSVSYDDRLAKRAMELFDFSRDASGFCLARFPSRHSMVIPPFSLAWVWMLHDFLYWRNDPDWLLQRLPGMRAIVEAFESHRNEDGLIENLGGWNFVDWVPEWRCGVPPGAAEVSAIINLQYLLTLRKVSELEEAIGDPWLARRAGAKGDELANAIEGRFWDSGKGIFAEAESDAASQHAQIIALLTGSFSSEKEERLLSALVNDSDLAQATIYFRHYLFEAFGRMGRADLILDGFLFWRELRALGLFTPIEQNEPSRSDCHGWSTHPLFHLFAYVLGIRPANPGFRKVTITPSTANPGPIAARIAHPDGFISFRRSRTGRKDRFEIQLPAGIAGELYWRGRTHSVSNGRLEIEV